MKTISLEDQFVIQEYEDELCRVGNYECIFPIAENVDIYAPYFEHERYCNSVLALWCKYKAKWRASTPRSAVSSLLIDDTDDDAFSTTRSCPPLLLQPTPPTTASKSTRSHSALLRNLKQIKQNAKRPGLTLEQCILPFLKSVK